jgi:Mut7-C ubiquitin
VTSSVSVSVFAGFIPPEVISVAARWYLRYGLSYRDVESCWPSGVSPLITSPSTRGGPVRVGGDGVSSLGHMVQSLGVPLTKVGRLAVNGRPVPPRVPA